MLKALINFSEHIQTLSELENSTEEVELEETQIPKFCEGLMDQIRDKVKTGVTLTVNAPNMSAPIHKAYVSHILLHLLKLIPSIRNARRMFRIHLICSNPRTMRI